MVIQTNTLIFTNLNPQVFEKACTVLKEKLDAYGHLEKLVALKSFGRILCVFNDTKVAIQIKEDLHKSNLLGIYLGVYFGQHTDLNCLDPEAGKRLNLLQVPEQERNFLLSPPGSPVY